MVQVKKKDVGEAILNSAFQLFLSKGYSDTTLSEISRLSGVTVSNIYNYFDSKLEILAALYGPWFDDQLTELFGRIAAQSEPRQQLKTLIKGLIQEIPEKDDGFAHLWLEAISSRRPDEIYSREMLLNLESRVSEVLQGIIPAELGDTFTEQNRLTHLLFMAFDGFAINYHVAGKSKRADAIAEMLTDSIFAAQGEIAAD